MRGVHVGLVMALCIALAGIARQATAQQPATQSPIILKLSHFLGPTSFFEVDFAQPWARELEAKTGGRVHVEIYNAASPFGGVTDQSAQVKAGTIDIALGLRGAEGDRFPRTSIIEMPFVVSDAATGSDALWTLFKQGAFGGEFGDFKVLALFVQNPGLIHTAARPVTAPADIRGLRLRAPNKAVAVALQQLGATPAILQVNDVMPAVHDGRLDGIVTNWGNPLPGFNDAMKYHTEVAFYTSVFFVVMNKDRFAGLPQDVQAAIEQLSNETLVRSFGLLWNKWDAPVRDGANGPGHTIIVPNASTMAAWREALRPVTERYLDELTAGGFGDARAVYARLAALLPKQ